MPLPAVWTMPFAEPPAAVPALVTDTRLSASAARVAGERSARPTPPSLSSDVSTPFAEISDRPAAFVAISDLPTALERTSDLPTAPERISDLPTALVRIWALPTLMAA